MVVRHNQNSQSLKIIDDGGDSFALATNLWDSTHTTMEMIWIATNIAAGTYTVTLTNTSGGTALNFTPRAYEFNNIAAYAPLDAVGANNGTGTAVTTTSMTPSQSGDLLFTAADYDNGTGSTNWIQGSQSNIGWSLLTGDTSDSFGDQWGVYSSTAAITPAMTMNPSASWVSCSIALKASVSSQGSPMSSSGMQIASVIHQAFSSYSASTRKPTLTNYLCLAAPTNCNLMLALVNSGGPNNILTNLIDTCGNTWKEDEAGAQSNNLPTTDWWIATNAICSPTNVGRMYWKNTNGDATVIFFMVAGASADPYTARQHTSGNLASGTTISVTPPPTFPTLVTNSILFMEAGWDNGTGTNFTTGQRFIGNYFASENLDGPCNFDENNGFGLTNVATTDAQPITWKMRVASGPNDWQSDAFLITPSYPPKLLATDRFNRANETPLSGGGNWTTVPSTGGTMNLTANQVVPNSLTADAAYCWTGSGSFGNDQYSQAEITGGNFASGSGMGVIVRGAHQSRTYYFAMVDNNTPSNCQLCKFVAGTFTALWTRTVTYSAGAPLRLSVTGTTLTVTYNGSAVGANTTDNSISTGKVGIAFSSNDSAISLDNWQGGTP